MAVNQNWKRVITLTIPAGQVTLFDTFFPMWLGWNGTSGNLPAEVYNASSLSPKSDGSDIRFTSDAAGTTEVPFEIVTFTPNSTVANARVEIYAQIPRIDSSYDCYLYMWYNNAAATAYAVTDPYGRNNVWNNHQVAVWHMNEGNCVDSTGNGNTGTDNGTSAATTVLGTARSFNATSGNFISIAGLLGSMTSLSITAYVNFTGSGTNGSDFFSIGDNVSCRLFNAIGGYQNSYRYAASAWRANTTNNNFYGTGLHQLTYSLQNGGPHTNYYDGANPVTDAYTDATLYGALGANTIIGKHGNGSALYNFGGIIDELRIYNLPRTQNWLHNQYNSLINAPTFTVPNAPQMSNSWFNLCLSNRLYNTMRLNR